MTQPSESKSLLWWLEKLIIPVLLIVIGTYITKIIVPGPLEVTIENQLALPITVNVNNKPEYSEVVAPGSSVTIPILSEQEFPARIYWRIQRHKNNGGQLIGEELKNFGNGENTDDTVVLDRGGKYVVDNKIGVSTYFYPIIENSTATRCTIVVNDGLTIQYIIGVSSPNTTANQTGYYKYASNSNVTLKCPNNIYYRGERNCKRGPKLVMEAGSGIVRIPIP